MIKKPAFFANNLNFTLNVFYNMTVVKYLYFIG
jgi:hypothetical protein